MDADTKAMVPVVDVVDHLAPAIAAHFGMPEEAIRALVGSIALPEEIPVTKVTYVWKP